MAYVDPRELSYTEEEIESGDAISGVVYNPPPPTTIVAERDDDFLSLARKLNVDVGDLVRANPETDTVSAGAAYSVPQPTPEPTPDPYADVPRAMPGETTEEFLQRINPPPPPPPGERQTFYDWASGLEGGDFGGGLQNIIPDIAEWIRNLFLSAPDSSGGVGTGAGAVFGTGGLTQPGAFGITEPVQQPRQRADTTVVSATDPRANRPSERQAYYAGDIPRPGTDEYYQWLVDTSPYPPGTQEFFAFANQMEGYPQVPAGPLSQDYFGEELTPEEKLRRDWEEIYMNPENKGRGGGIVEWIEERTGLDIDPQTFFTEDRSEEVLSAMLNEFRPDELAYLESQGILVPVEEQGALPLYGGSGGDYQYPLYYGSGNRDSGPTYRRQPILGLTSWSI